MDERRNRSAADSFRIAAKGEIFMKLIAVGTLAAAGLLSACSTYSDYADAPEPAPSQQSANADVRDRAGNVKAQASATQVGNSIRVSLNAANMPQGVYAAHVHMTGRCDAPDFTTAGGHWNPTNRQHGKDNPAGMHKGDLPNLLVGADGRGSLEYTITDASLVGGSTAMMDRDGADIVVHASPDDYRTDPSGNSGGRIACGVFG